MGEVGLLALSPGCLVRRVLGERVGQVSDHVGDLLTALGRDGRQGCLAAVVLGDVVEQRGCRLLAVTAVLHDQSGHAPHVRDGGDRAALAQVAPVLAHRQRRSTLEQIPVPLPVIGRYVVAAGGPLRQADEVAGPHPGPAVHVSDPLAGEGVGAVARTEQSAGDGGHGVGVVTDHDGADQGGAHVGGTLVVDCGADDRGPGGLEGGHGEPVGGEGVRILRLCLVDPQLPVGPAFVVDEVQTSPQVEDSVENRPADCFRPQDAAVAGERVVVGEPGNLASGAGGGVSVIEVADPHDGVAHDAAVACSPARPLVQSCGDLPHGRRGVALLAVDRPEHLGRLHADVSRVVGIPVEEVRRDRVEGRRRA